MGSEIGQEIAGNKLRPESQTPATIAYKDCLNVTYCTMVQKEIFKKKKMFFCWNVTDLASNIIFFLCKAEKHPCVSVHKIVIVIWNMTVVWKKNVFDTLGPKMHPCILKPFSQA